MLGATSIILILALLLSYSAVSSNLTVAMFALAIAAGLLLWRMRTFVAHPSALFTPSAGTVFSEYAPTGKQGEVLIAYQSYAQLHRRFVRAGIYALGLGLLSVVGLRVLPVPTTVIVLPLGLAMVGIAGFAVLSLLTLVPAGSRLTALRKLFAADPRQAFARYAPTEANGALKVGYSTYKKWYKATTIVATCLLIVMLALLWQEISFGSRAARDNIVAAQQQLAAVIDTLQTGQGDLGLELQKLAAQSLTTGPTIDENSLTQRILASVTSQLPDAPVQIEKTTVVERTIVEPGTIEAIQLKEGAKFVVKDSSGATFFTFGTDTAVILEENSIFNIAGEWQIAGTKIEASADNINILPQLNDTDSGSEGAREIGTQSGNFTNFTPSRNDVEAALAAIDTALGNVGGGDATSQFLVLSASAAQANERVLTAGTGLSLADAGAGSTATLNLDEFTLGTTDTNATAGSVLFAGTAGVLQQDNANFFWNDSSNEFYLGGATSGAADTYLAATGAATFNEQGNDADFRVESDNKSNMFVIDGGSDVIAIRDTIDANNLITATFDLATANTNSYFLDATFNHSGGISTAGLSKSVYGYNMDMNVSGTVEGNSTTQTVVGNYLDIDDSTTILNTDASATYKQLVGDYVDVSYSGTMSGVNTQLSMYGEQLIVQTTGASALSSAFGSSISVSGDAPNKYGIYLDTGGTSGTNYGLYVDSTNTAASNTGIYIDASGGTTNIGLIVAKGSAVFNEIGGDSDFRVEGDTEPNLIFVDASTDNIGIGLTTFGTDAKRVLAFANGTAPSSNASGPQLYATSGELRVRDTSSNVTTLSPHNFALFTPEDESELPWSFYSYNEDFGREINVDMYGAIEAVEQLAGKQFIYTRDLNTGEETHFVEANDNNNESDSSETALTFDLETELTTLLKQKPALLNSFMTPTTTTVSGTELANSTTNGDIELIRGDLAIVGILTLSSSHGGYASIPTGTTSVTVQFEHAFKTVPVVTLTALNHFVPYRLQSVTTQGFTIVLESAVTSDARFSYLAVPIQDLSAASAGAVAGTQSTSTPPPAGGSTPIATEEAEPSTPSAEATTEPTPPPASESTPEPTPKVEEPENTPIPSAESTLTPESESEEAENAV